MAKCNVFLGCKRYLRGLGGDGAFCILIVPMSISSLTHCITALQDVTIGGGWVKGTWDLSALLPTAQESTTISN